MNTNTINLRDIKKMRLERHWSQDQLSEMSGLSIRTIQRIENGENAGLESLKSLAAVFEINITDSDKKEEMEQIRKDWSEIKSNDSWSIFKIMSEFVQGFEKRHDIGNRYKCNGRRGVIACRSSFFAHLLLWLVVVPDA